MEGRYVVAGLLTGVVVLGSAAWAWGLSVKASVDAEAAKHNLRRMSPTEAAEVVAREDRFGLPSRLENAPKRDIEVFRKLGTDQHPLTIDASGTASLFEIYRVSVEGCAKTHLRGTPAWATEPEVGVEVRTIGERARVSKIVPPSGEPWWDAFVLCLGGAVRPAVFQPGDEAVVVRQRLELPK